MEKLQNSMAKWGNAVSDDDHVVDDCYQVYCCSSKTHEVTLVQSCLKLGCKWRCGASVMVCVTKLKKMKNSVKHIT